MSKQVNKEELVTNVNNALKDTEQLRYEGMKLADRLFTISHKDNGKSIGKNSWHLFWQQV